MLRFRGGGSKSRLDHVSVAYGSGVFLEGASPSLDHVLFKSHSGAALTMDLTSAPSGVGNRATGNLLDGIDLPAGDIGGSATWGLRGIPYLVRSGQMSVGTSPGIASLSPNTVVQGGRVDAVLTGTRLSGIEGVSANGLGVTLRGGAGDNTIPITISAPAGAALGAVDVRARVAAGSPVLPLGLTVIAPLAIGGLSPASLRRGQKLSFTASGANLGGVTVAADADIAVSGVSAAANGVQFNLAAAPTAALGPHGIVFTNASKSWTSTQTVQIRPVLPTLSVSPSPLGLLAGGAGSLTLLLSNADDVDHGFNLGTSPAGVVSVSPSSITIPAGATRSASIAVQAGATNGASQLQVNATDGSLASVQSLIMVGQQISSVSPNIMALGSGPNLLTVTGFGLGAVTALTVDTVANSHTTNANITLGAWSVSAEGSVLTVPVTVANNAAVAQAYYVTAWIGNQSLGLVATNANRFDVKAMSNDLIAMPLGVTVGTVAGGTAGTAQVFAPPAGVNVGVGGTGAAVQLFARPAGVTVGGASAGSSQVFAAPAGVTVGTASNTAAQLFASPAGVTVGSGSSSATTQVFAPSAGVSVGVGGAAGPVQVFAQPAGVTAGPVLTVLDGLRVWLRADGPMTTSSGRVTTWANLVPSVGHAANWPGVNGPTWVNTVLNGKPVLRFSGSEALQLPAGILSGQQYTVLAVVNDTRPAPPADYDFREVISNWQASGNTTTSVYLGMTAYGGKNRLRFTDCLGGWNDAHLTRNGVGAQNTPTRHFILTGLGAAGNASVYVNDLLVASRGFPIPTRAFGTPFSIGRQGSAASEYWIGDMAEILVYGRALDPATELPSVWNYLSQKYGLQVATAESDASPVGYCPGVGGEWFN